MKYTLLLSLVLSMSQTAPAIAETYGMPFRFEANRGQAKPGVKYVAYAAGFTADLNENEVRLNLASPITMRFSGRTANTQLEPLSKMGLRSNYYRGGKENWHTDIENYERIIYRDVYPGIDVLFRGNGRVLEFDFLAMPGSNTNAIALEFTGSRAVTIADDGSLVLTTAGGEARLHPPLIFQNAGAQRHSIAGRFVKRGQNRIGIDVPSYDATQLLVIDPALTFSTYSDAGGNEQPTDIALDRAGNIYLTYTTFDAFDENEFQFVVQKIPRDGSSGYITRIWELNTNSYANALAIDASGNAYIAGTADNTPPAPTTLPSKNAIQPHDAGGTDAYIVKLDPAGKIVFATYLGGSGNESANAIALDGLGGVWIGGSTSSTNFPTRNAYQNNNGGVSGSADGFLTKIDAAGTRILYSTYLGGQNEDAISRLAIDADGGIIVAGVEDSARIFVRKFNAAGTAVLHNAFLGQSGLQDDLIDFALAFDGSMYVARGEHGSSFNYYLDKINPSFQLVYSKLLPAQPRGIATDPQANVYVTGGVDTDRAAKPLEFPVVNSFRLHAASDVYVTKFPADGSFPIYSTLLSGTCTICIDPVFGQGSNERGEKITVDANGRAFVAGISEGEDFPTTNGTRRSGFSKVSQQDAIVFVLDTTPAFSTTEYTRLEEWFPPVAYSGNWYTQNSATAGHSGNSAKLAMDAGSQFAISFTGSGDLKWYGCSDQYAGIAKVFLDGTLRATVDTYGSPGGCHRLLWSATGIGAGAHTFMVEVTGTKSAISKGKWVWIDDVEITSTGDITIGAATPPSSGGGGSTGGSGAYTRFEENSSAVQLTSKWNVNSMSTHSAGRAVLSITDGASATFSFNGTAARWIGWQDRWSGIAKIYVDGVFKTDIDTYSATNKSKQVLYSITGLASGNHSLAVVTTGRRSSLSAAAWVWVDAFEALGTGGASPPQPPPSDTRVEQDNVAVTKTGTWNTHTATMHSGGSAILSISAGARATFSFTGTEIRWIGLRDPWSGFAKVYVDGVLKGTVDTYAPTTQSNVVLYALGSLSAGPHTIVVEATGNRNSSASGAWVWVDAFEYH